MGIRKVLPACLVAVALAVAACRAEGPLPAGPERGGAQESGAGPRVAAGLVRWHPDFEAALRAAETSGRPVLLFDMLGRLDREHC